MGNRVLDYLNRQVDQLLTGPDWEASIPALQVLALVGIVHAVQYVNGTAMMALGRADLRLATQVVHSVVNVIGFAIVAGGHMVQTTVLGALSPILRLLLGTGIGATIYRRTIGVLDRRL